MNITDMHWQQVEEYLKHDDRAVVPLGSTEQHAYLSLSVDSILSQRLALDSAESLNVAVFPGLNYGITPYFTSYPGTISLRVSTYLEIIRDMLDGLANSGFKRILFVNGHGGNSPAKAILPEWMAKNPQVNVKWHNWWAAPQTRAKTLEFDPIASHASWSENFPWTRLADATMPDTQKPPVDVAAIDHYNPAQTREALGDGNYGGHYQRPDEEMLAIWDVAVAETQTLIESGW